jgi:hypothetical protein
LAVAIVATALVLVPTPASAQYQTTCGFILDPPEINVGGTVTNIGSRFGPGNTVTFYIANTQTPDDKVVLGTAVSDDDQDGNLRATFPLPAGFDTDGEYLITAECPAGDIASNVLIVGVGNTSATPTATATSLPVTGSGDLPVTLARLGVLALALGGIVLLATRRQRRSSAV